MTKQYPSPQPFPADFDKVFDVINASTESEELKQSDKNVAIFLLVLAKRNDDTHIDVSVLHCASDFPPAETD